MPWSAVAGAIVSSAVNGIMAPDQQSGNSATTQQAAQAADPFQNQRPGYMQALSDMMYGKGSSVGADPSSKFRLDKGFMGIERSSAASGMYGSGNMGIALEDYRHDLSTTDYANQFSRLAQLAGANIGNPGTAGQIIAGQAQANQQSQAAFGATIGKAVSNTNWGNVLGGSSGGGGGGGEVNLGSVSGSDMDVAF